MTTKRSKGFNSLDLAMPVAPYYRTDPQVLKDVETMRTNAASRWAKDDYSRTLSRFHTTDDNASKIATLAQPRVEILRSNSPTLKRLVAARIKLEKYSNSISRLISPSRHSARSIRETPYPKTYEKQSTVISQPVQAPPPPPPPRKQIKPQSTLGNGALDKITYEQTWSNNGNMKQKCSLEIWLPKPSLDDDDDRNTNRTVTPEGSPPTINIETKSVNEVSSRKSDPAVIPPRVYHYGDYIMDLPDERPRSSKSVTTVKSDSAASIKSIRRLYTRPHTRRQSVSTHHSEEILRFGTIEVPTSPKTISVYTQSTSPSREAKPIPKPSNPSMISELMQKYSLIKKNHQELIQTKLQLEKPNNDSKMTSTITTDVSTRPRPPLIPESTSIVLPDQPTVSVKKLLIDTSPSHNNNTNANTKLLERRSTPHKPSPTDVYPHLRIFSLANQRQHRQSSASVPAALLPNVSGRKTEDTYRTLQRSKTLDVVLDIPSPVKVKSRVPPTQPDSSSSHLLYRTGNGTNEQIPSRTSKRSALNLRSVQQNSVSIVQNGGHPFHRSSTTTSIPTNAVFIHFKHGNTDRNYVVPE